MSTETKTLTNADAKIQPKLGVKALVQIGMLSAIAIILMMFEIPLPFAPTFYKIDLSEVPVLVGCFAMGPMAGVLVELVKILLNLVMTGTSTAGVGEIANFIIGCSFCVPAGLIYRKKQNKKKRSDRNGNRNSPDDRDWMLREWIRTSPDLCKSIWNAD